MPALHWHEVPPRTRRGSAAGVLEPFAQALVNLGVVQQREMMGGAHVVAVLGLEWDAPGASPSGGAGHKHEDVAEEAAPGDGAGCG